MTSQTSRAHLHRLDDTTWSYIPSTTGGAENAFEEIRMQLSPMSDGRDAYTLIHSIITIFEKNKEMLTRNLFKKGFKVRVHTSEHEEPETWRIAYHRVNCAASRLFSSGMTKLKQYIPFTRTIRKRRTAVIDVRQCNGGVIEKITSVAKRFVTFAHSTHEEHHHPLAERIDLASAQNPIRRIRDISFRDPFSTLSRIAFKTVEKWFVMENEHRGTYRFIVDHDSRLSLVEDDIPQDKAENELYREQNRAVVRAYKDFLLSEFGADFLASIDFSFNIHFQQMLEEGLPLYPDHVCKCNIGANSIELSHVEQVFEGLKKIYARIDDLKKRSSQAQAESLGQEGAAEFLLNVGAEIPISIRVLRGILRSMPRGEALPTVSNLYDFLSEVVGQSPPQSVRLLLPTLFNTVVDMIMPSDAERKKTYTGRRIRHLPIMGFHTMGNPNVSNRARDLFELLHIFDDCRKKEDWKNFFELLSHVVVKKSIFRETPTQPSSPPLSSTPPVFSKDQQLHVGLLIPAPNANTGERRWYFNESFFDDSQGNVNYVLLPACQSYSSYEGRPLPMVKLYRSTASNRNAENWHDSIAADLNPHGSPGSLNPELSFKYEFDHFAERTIPVWMGHLLMALRMKNWEKGASSPTGECKEMFTSSYEENIREAATQCKTYLQKFHPTTDLSTLCSYIEQEETENLEKLLIAYGHQFKEDPRYKIHQDVACVGHSLGGALSQAGAYLFSTHLKRMPLPGHQFICYSSDGPAIDNSKDAEFMKFGRHHQELFQFLHVKWKIYHQFEFGDFVPQAGGSHLGTTEYNRQKDKSWLDESAVVFRPLQGDAPAVVSSQTHGRRIGLATPERDYTITKITPTELSEFDHSYWLSARIRSIWGYRIFNSPRISEWVRKKVGLLTLPAMKIINFFEGQGIGTRDENGVLAVRYEKPAESKPV